MKKLIFALAMVFALFSSCGVSEAYKASAKEAASMRDTRVSAMAATPIPAITHFQERKTIAKWAERWDKPSLPCYVYIVSFGAVLGYYVSDGKPSSTRSYLFPEWERGGEGLALPTSDLDGTYGENNPGIRFFTASGIAVEWGGSGASYIYSDAPLKLNVPLLGE